MLSTDVVRGKHVKRSIPNVKCHENGRFYRNPERPEDKTWTVEECAKYYLCLEGDVFEFRCSQGLLFDVNRQLCDMQQNVHNCDLTAGMYQEPSRRQDVDGGEMRQVLPLFGRRRVRVPLLAGTALRREPAAVRHAAERAQLRLDSRYVPGTQQETRRGRWRNAPSTTSVWKATCSSSVARRDCSSKLCDMQQNVHNCDLTAGMYQEPSRRQDVDGGGVRKVLSLFGRRRVRVPLLARIAEETAVRYI
ncbi:hypothetical protein O0L34_g527 [Tuta absoluta]|nr:hypothetical protein O0L34_g527 [Tuta absoluta]